VQLVISAHAGLKAAIQAVLIGAAWQRLSATLFRSPARGAAPIIRRQVSL
jgi:hypothetical protein